MNQLITESQLVNKSLDALEEESFDLEGICRTAVKDLGYRLPSEFRVPPQEVDKSKLVESLKKFFSEKKLSIEAEFSQSLSSKKPAKLQTSQSTFYVGHDEEETESESTHNPAFDFDYWVSCLNDSDTEFARGSIASSSYEYDEAEKTTYVKRSGQKPKSDIPDSMGNGSTSRRIAMYLKRTQGNKKSRNSSSEGSDEKEEIKSPEETKTKENSSINPKSCHDVPSASSSSATGKASSDEGSPVLLRQKSGKSSEARPLAMIGSDYVQIDLTKEDNEETVEESSELPKNEDTERHDCNELTESEVQESTFNPESNEVDSSSSEECSSETKDSSDDKEESKKENEAQEEKSDFKDESKMECSSENE